MGKGEIARHKQFLLFTQCFQKACFPGASKGVIVWEWVKTCIVYQAPDRNMDIVQCISGIIFTGINFITLSNLLIASPQGKTFLKNKLYL